MGEMTVNSAVGNQARQMKGGIVSEDMSYSLFESNIVEGKVILDFPRDFGQLLIEILPAPMLR
jgi:hypothetical protein